MYMSISSFCFYFLFVNVTFTFCLTVFGTDADQPGLDLSEFPTLGNRNLPSTPISSVRNYGQCRVWFYFIWQTSTYMLTWTIAYWHIWILQWAWWVNQSRRQRLSFRSSRKTSRLFLEHRVRQTLSCMIHQLPYFFSFVSKN